MRSSYKILRFFAVALLSIVVGLPIALYLVMSLPPVQERLRQLGEDELSRLLRTEVTIGRVSLSPYTRIEIDSVNVSDATGGTALHVGRIGAGVSLSRLLLNRRLTVNYVELIDADLHISRDSSNSPLNIAPIIEALKPKNKSNGPTHFDLQVNTVVLRRISATYDVASAPAAPQGKLDPNHIAVTDLKADVTIPRLRNDDIIVYLKRLSLTERSGLELTDLHADVHFSSNNLSVADAEIHMPGSTLRLADMDISFTSPDKISEVIASTPHRIALLPASRLYLPDFSPLLPALSRFTTPIEIETDITGTPDSIAVDKLNIALSGRNTWLMCHGQIDSITDPKARKITLERISFNATGNEIDSTLTAFTRLSPKAMSTISNLGEISLDGRMTAEASRLKFRGSLSTDPGSFDLDIKASQRHSHAPLQAAGHIVSSSFDIGAITGNEEIGSAGFDIGFDITSGQHTRGGDIECTIQSLEWRGYRYADISTSFTFDNDSYTGSFSINDPCVALQADGSMAVSEIPAFDFTASVDHVDLDSLNLWHRYPGHNLSARIDAHFTGATPDSADGTLSVSNLHFTDSTGTGLDMAPISIEAFNSSVPQHISISAGFLDGSIEGSYSFKNIVPTIKEIVAHVFPAVTATDDEGLEEMHAWLDNGHDRHNNFTYGLTLRESEQLFNFFRLPVRILYPIEIRGALNHEAHSLTFKLDAPYLQQKDKLIRNSAVRVDIAGYQDRALLYATTNMPTKNGDMTLNVTCSGSSNRLDSRIGWRVASNRDFHGDINFSTAVDRDTANLMIADITFNPTEIVINDTTWHINRSDIAVRDKRITVDNFDIRRDRQSINIDGVASADSTDMLILRLREIDLDYVFGTLNIDNVMFGGEATGDFFGTMLLSKSPELHTPCLHVKGLKYNHSLMGDTDIRSAWHNDTKAVSINAIVSQANGHQSLIDGAIYPLTEELDFHFKADKVGVGFMQPFMAAFADEVSGFASGSAHLYGTFKYLDMTGDLYADDFKVKLGFTNTTYSASDSIHMRPGLIDISNLTIRDRDGHTATLNGRVTHRFFKTPAFDFSLTGARNFLSYDVGPTEEHPWHGRIYGNGSAYINGQPGVVNIGVNMATAPGSTFTFVLSDAEIADEYSFITFRDRNATTVADTLSLAIGSPELDKIMTERVRKNREAESASAYNMNFQVDVTPNAQMNLVMDPVGGDKIVAYGAGNINIQYESANDLFRMFGTYTLNRGNYNFTLQDIIIKDFTIRDGSSIAFHGDPYAAQLDINAIYALNANLSDLDESFLTDKDLNRTNVPVHAVLNVAGDMRQPDISFDLEFPTLTSDVYRKVRSIVSTEDMMNRQIIYLLALNRFYTPDYMASTTKGNELVSVASSTISSQLSSILGQLSDNWSVAPTVRTDRGDFSDVEVDLALSSTLLNNRLLLNGNLGYRDNVYNDNSFIGDFDIEYLLNRSGNIRLKAYNRYNDQNYYVKTALTTQGIGIVFKRDFDNIFSFLRPWLRKSAPATAAPAPADTIPATPLPADNDSIPAIR